VRCGTDGRGQRANGLGLAGLALIGDRSRAAHGRAVRRWDEADTGGFQLRDKHLPAAPVLLRLPSHPLSSAIFHGPSLSPHAHPQLGLALFAVVLGCGLQASTAYSLGLKKHNYSFRLRSQKVSQKKILRYSSHRILLYVHKALNTDEKN